MESNKSVTTKTTSFEGHLRRFRGLCIIMIVLCVLAFALSGYGERLNGGGADVGVGQPVVDAGGVGQQGGTGASPVGDIANSIGQGLGGGNGGGSMLSGL